MYCLLRSHLQACIVIYPWELTVKAVRPFQFRDTLQWFQTWVPTVYCSWFAALSIFFWSRFDWNLQALQDKSVSFISYLIYESPTVHTFLLRFMNHVHTLTLLRLRWLCLPSGSSSLSSEPRDCKSPDRSGGAWEASLRTSKLLRTKSLALTWRWSSWRKTHQKIGWWIC